MIELLKEEISKNFKNYWEGEYNLHCSFSVAEALKKDFLSKSSPITQFPLTVDGETINSLEEAKVTGYALPYIGKINIIQDMEQGYKIEKI